MPAIAASRGNRSFSARFMHHEHLEGHAMKPIADAGRRIRSQSIATTLARLRAANTRKAALNHASSNTN
jgi:hypothetical protein